MGWKKQYIKYLVLVVVSGLHERGSQNTSPRDKEGNYYTKQVPALLVHSIIPLVKSFNL